MLRSEGTGELNGNAGSMLGNPVLWMQVVVFVGTCLLYYVAGHFALRLLSEPTGIAVYWPASGIAAGLIVSMPRPARLPIVLAVVAATIVANLEAGSGLAVSSVFAACNAFGCILFAKLLQRLDADRSRLESLPGVFAFVAATVVAAGLAAIPGALGLSMLGMTKSAFLPTWLTWFKSDALGIITMAPAIVTFPSLLRKPPRPVLLLESFVALAITIALAWFAFTYEWNSPAWPIIAPTTILFPAFLWLAGRAPAWFCTMAALASSVVIVMASLTGSGRLGDHTIPLNDRLLAAEVGVLTASLAVLTLSAMFTRLRNVADALKSSERQLELSLAAGSIYAFDFDLDRGVVVRTGGLLDKLLLPPAGLIDDYRKALSPADLQAFEQMLAELRTGTPRVERIFHLRTKDGEMLTIEHRAEAVLDDDRRLTNIRGTCTDITAHEAAKKALEAHEAELRHALIAGRVFTFEYDAITHGATRSENAAQILGISLDVAKASRNLFVEYIHPDDRRALENYRRRLSPAQPFTSDRFRFMRPDGGVAWLELSATGEYDEHGRLLKLRGLCRDVTEQKLAEDRQLELIKELDHRVKNALATVTDVITLSREEHDTIEAFMAKIDGRIGAMARAHNRLTSTKWSGVEVADLVGDAIAPYLSAGNTRIDGPVVVLPPAIAQSFALTVHELATNAAKHGALVPNNGTVEISWRLAHTPGEPERLHWAWREQTRRPVAPPQRESYGLQAIRRQLPHAHAAKVDVRFTPSGLHCEIVLSLRQASATATPPASSTTADGVNVLQPAATHR